LLSTQSRSRAGGSRSRTDTGGVAGRSDWCRWRGRSTDGGSRGRAPGTNPEERPAQTDGGRFRQLLPFIAEQIIDAVDLGFRGVARGTEVGSAPHDRYRRIRSRPWALPGPGFALCNTEDIFPPLSSTPANCCACCWSCRGVRICTSTPTGRGAPRMSTRCGLNSNTTALGSRRTWR
jgi:hypothetical protein